MRFREHDRALDIPPGDKDFLVTDEYRAPMDLNVLAGYVHATDLVYAGGLGLNLTAAEYVFLLDPWWNPAVEAQAIDRAHRIGQSRHVFAYRLLAHDTVEEKVAELQQTKRELADAILNADGGLVRSLGAADLEMLLS